MPELKSTLVEVCVFRFVGDAPEVLLLRRAASEMLYPGLWQFVTGSLQPGETAVDAAKREVHEETGLSVRSCWTVPHVNSFYDHANDQISLMPVFAAQVAAHDAVRLSAEHDAFEWLPVADAQKRLVWPGQRQALKIALDYIIRGGLASNLLTL